MMAMGDGKKKPVMVIAAKFKKEGPDSEMVEETKEENPDVGLESAAEELMVAIEKKDAKMLKEALRSFIEMCPSEESESED